MTHKELLAKIDLSFKDIPVDYGQADAHKALRAVVELHKPIEEDGKLWCSHEVCYSHIEFLERDDCECDYPCPTIKAIEKELQVSNQ